VGHSLGGLAVLALAEGYPGQYDAALPVCAPLGGGIPEVQYLGHARVLFDYFFPQVVPGDAFDVPADLPFAPGSPLFTATQTALIQGLFAPGQPTLQFARVAGLPFTSIPELVTSAMSVVGFSIRFTNDVLDRTHGHVPFDNMDTVYAGSADDATLNARVERFSATPDAANYFERFYTPSGDLQIPTLTLHTRLDPVVPFWHEAAYAVTTAQAGSGGQLVQRSIARYGHCAVSPAETAAAFADLVQWADGGAKPAGGDGTVR
jgi:pimeloyl-ACP methyl ester carboxylesterase